MGPKVDSCATSASACARPFLSSGRILSSPENRDLLPAVPCRTIRTDFVSGGCLAHRRNTFRSYGYDTFLIAAAADSQMRSSTSLLGAKLPPMTAGRPVLHLLGALLDRIAHRRDPAAQLNVVPRLFEDLTNGGHRLRLAGVDLALGQRPVVVTRTVDHRNFGGGFAVPGSPQHATRGENDLARRATRRGLCRHLNSCRSIRAPGTRGQKY